MPWEKMPKKDVVACDKPRGAGKQALIRGCPNGETLPTQVGEPCLTFVRHSLVHKVKSLSSFAKATKDR